MKVHELKSWPEGFQAVLDGRKPFEVRKDDRGFEVGDTLHLREYQPMPDTYTGRETDVRVTYIYRGDFDELASRIVVMGIAHIWRTRPIEPDPGLRNLTARGATICWRCEDEYTWGFGWWHRLVRGHWPKKERD